MKQNNSLIYMTFSMKLFSLTQIILLHFLRRSHGHFARAAAKFSSLLPPPVSLFSMFNAGFSLSFSLCCC